MADFPAMLSTVNQVEAVPRRIRGLLGREVVVDSSRVLYVWEWPGYPQYYVPSGDVRMDLLHATGGPEPSPQGEIQVHTVGAGGVARLVVDSPLPGLAGHVRFEWSALDQWFEEDEEVFVHPRNPYTRVDTLRSSRTVRVELDGVVLADSAAPVMVVETGLPTRYYVGQADVRFEHLVASDTRTACPYKGRTTGYWSVVVHGTTHEDIAWLYDFPTAGLLAVTGRVAFLNERVDLCIDGQAIPRPVTHMS